MSRRASLVALALFTAGALTFAGCGDGAVPTTLVPADQAPDTFRVVFETTKGRFVVEAYREWAPLGAARLYQLAAVNALDDVSFYRVVPNFVAQFGAVGDPPVNRFWDTLRLADEPRVARNIRGTIALAQESRPNTRAHQMFINLSDNGHLDDLGFTPIGQVVEGMNVVDSIYAGYRERPDYHMISTLGNQYLKGLFPRIDYVRTARIVRQ